MSTAKILGVPTPEPTLVQWAHDLFRVFDQPIALENYAQMNKVAMEFRAYFNDLIAEKASNPQADLMSHLVNCHDQNKLSNDELLGFCAMLFSVGQETTENLIGNSLHALLNNPDQIQKIKEDPTLIAAAIEELLRYDSPVQLLARVALEDVDIDDQRIQTGDRVHLSLGAANRDPAVFSQPDRLDFGRTQQGIPFGGGIHYCLGAALARIQGQIAINTVVQRLAELQINREEPLEWRKNIVLRGLRTFPITFVPAWA